MRFTLNGSDASNTRANQFLNDSPGANVQHIAFSVDDMFKIARNIEQAGLPFCPRQIIIMTIFRPNSALKPRLPVIKTACILYDEDEYGQFLHLYCHLQDTGLFFEFVQRKAGYTGFGAANAPYIDCLLKDGLVSK